MIIICSLCRRKINLRKDDYIRIDDYKQGEFHMRGYYHNKCFHDKLEGKNEMGMLTKGLINLMARTERQLKRMEAEDE